MTTSRAARIEVGLWLWLTVALLGAVALLLVWGCNDGTVGEDSDDDTAVGDDDAADDDDDTSGDDDSSDDDDSTTDAYPCNGDSDWGMIPYDERPQYLFVDPAGSLSGTGTIEDPFQTIAMALEAAEQSGESQLIALSEGQHQANFVLDAATADLWIFGCSPDTTTVVPADVTDTVIGVRGTDGVRLGGMTIDGGAYGIVVAQSAGDDVPIQLEDLVITGATDVGLVVDGTSGGGTEVDAQRVVVRDTSPGAGERGWGVAVQEAELVVDDLTISNVTGLGLFGHLSDVTVENSAISAVATAADGTLGRGVHLQLLSGGALRQTTIDDTSDAGVFLNAPQAVILGSVTINNVGASLIPDSVATAGDGIVAGSGSLGFDPSLMSVTIDGCTIDTVARTGVVIDGTAVEVSSNTIANGVFMPGGWGIVSQNEAIVTGTDSVYDLDSAPEDALELNNELLDWVSVTLN